MGRSTGDIAELVVVNQGVHEAVDAIFCINAPELLLRTVAVGVVVRFVSKVGVTLSVWVVVFAITRRMISVFLFIFAFQFVLFAIEFDDVTTLVESHSLPTSTFRRAEAESGRTGTMKTLGHK